MVIPTLLLTGMLALVPTSTDTAPFNLYEWLARAPIIVIGTHDESSGKYDHFTVERGMRGATEAGRTIRVKVRRANRERDRELHAQPLALEPGESYLLLLTAVSTPGPETYELARGIGGAHELPREGRQVFVDAVERFVGMQDRKDEGATWREFGGMLEETNPILVETALEQFIKFRRGEPEHLGALQPLLAHPSELLRQRTTLLIGQILRLSREPVPETSSLRSDLISRARRDSTVAVRIAATEALGDLEGETILRILEEIAREDPDQSVRYAAEKLIYDRLRRPGASKEEVERSANGT